MNIKSLMTSLLLATASPCLAMTSDKTTALEIYGSNVLEVRKQKIDAQNAYVAFLANGKQLIAHNGIIDVYHFACLSEREDSSSSYSDFNNEIFNKLAKYYKSQRSK